MWKDGRLAGCLGRKAQDYKVWSVHRWLLCGRRTRGEKAKEEGEPKGRDAENRMTQSVEV